MFQAWRLRNLGGALYGALAKADWATALRTADAMLELAPDHVAARQARRKAWKALGLEATQVYHGHARGEPAALRERDRIDRLAASTRAACRASETDTVTNTHADARRLIAWIDAVGGFLVCLGDEIVIGRPDPAGPGADVLIQGDLSRRHAVIRREGEAYVLHPVGEATVDGARATGPTVLRDNAEIQLGDAVRLRFRRPHALSATAVLQVESSHKTKPAVDGIVLMSESCILGPKSHSHIACRRWSGDLVLFRHGDELRCRAACPLSIDGQLGVEQAAVVDGTRIEGDDFSLSFEEI